MSDCFAHFAGTNFPPELYDGHLFGKESYYDELAKAQKEEMDRREKQLEARKKAGDHRLKEAHVPSRKSKWDQQGPGVGGIKKFCLIFFKDVRIFFLVPGCTWEGDTSVWGVKEKIGAKK